MPFFGAHMSISGNPHKALQRGQDAGCQVIQIFTRHRVRWSAKDLSETEIGTFYKERLRTLVNPVAIHGSYLVNLASPNYKAIEKSLILLQKEMEWAELLDIPYLVIHPGSHMGDGEDRGLKRIAVSINRLYGDSRDYKVKILLENTAGQGSSLGYKFEHFAEILELVDFEDKVGVCFDTCHALAAGYDFRSKKAYGQVVQKFGNIIGVDKLKLFHINDSKTDLGSRIDRHEHPGCGLLGFKPFSFFINDRRFKNHPFILETPKGLDEDGVEYDVKNLEHLRNLYRGINKL